ncbi:hypothetical protein AB0I98_12935 [Streptomyces sp. NPDC050211]|uniref:hypothetical protein n=1 Tax=Streptomyces sp. NPDC050211 TaxID=3154932 RepID=UPI003442BD65
MPDRNPQTDPTSPPVPAGSESPRRCSPASPTTTSTIRCAPLAASGTRLTHGLSTAHPTAIARAHLCEADRPSTPATRTLPPADHGLRPEHLAALPGGGGLPRRETGRRLMSLDRTCGRTWSPTAPPISSGSLRG